MTTNLRRSLRAKKVSANNSNNELSDLEATSRDGDANDLAQKFSKLKTISSQTRRSQRLAKTPKKYRNDYFDTNDVQQNNESKERKIITQLSESSTKQGRKNLNKTSENELSDSPESNSDNEVIEKPSEVLFEDQDISGKAIFGFKRNKRIGGLAQRVLEAVNTPRLSSVLNNSVQNSSNSIGTSKNLMRQKMKEKVTELNTDSSFEDFSDSGSEYKESGSESESNTDVEEEAGSDGDEIYKNKTSSTTKKSKNVSTAIRNNATQNYIMKSDDYFSWQATSKIVTSNHTLQKLKNPKLSENQLQELLTSCSSNQSTEHEKAIHEMFKYSCSFFNKWLLVLHEGFNVLLYGLGSKRNILTAFHKEMLQSSPTIVVNGYFPSLTIKDITDSILIDIFEVQSPSNVYEAVELIERRCERQKNIHLYIIVHNIDGPMLRNSKSQNVLSSLADIPNIYLLASIDHINTPLIWDHYKMSKFNFTWWDVTSFLSYSDETSFESSMLIQRSGALALSSLGNVYQSLTKNSKGVFMLIVKYQLNNKSVKYYQGMPFKVLYSQCREHFLVSSDLALRTQLTEFLDHKLVKSKRTTDGVEQLIIPINNSLLQQFLDQHQS